MNIPDLKQLNKLIALCRKQGVRVIKLGDMELTLEDLPTKPPRNTKLAARAEPISGSDIYNEDSLTEQQLLEWSVMSIPNPSETEAN